MMTRKTSLWWLALSPLIWAIHFTTSYVVAAIACAKFPDQFSDIKTWIWILTAISLIIIFRELVISWKRHTHGDSSPPHDAPTSYDRERFLGLARLLISSLSFIAVIYTSYVVWYFRSCR